MWQRFWRGHEPLEPTGEEIWDDGLSTYWPVHVTDRAGPDPLAMMRSAMDQWEKLANEYGAQFLERPETSQAMHRMTSGVLQFHKMTQEAIGKALAAANVPSRKDIEALSARLGAIESSLARLEAGMGSSPSAAGALPRPPRTRKPPVRP